MVASLHRGFIGVGAGDARLSNRCAAAFVHLVCTPAVPYRTSTHQRLRNGKGFNTHVYCRRPETPSEIYKRFREFRRLSSEAVACRSALMKTFGQVLELADELPLR